MQAFQYIMQKMKWQQIQWRISVYNILFNPEFTLILLLE